ncbi:SLC2A4 regulator [Pseudonaja textilis]|uniref:SLC2A4 regulator n=1 Tax=Pseudonaja textilis TaxID=8673 RepID=UPI000EA88841|nr:SLC2A4 regulator [Pseudonaja textilis]
MEAPKPRLFKRAASPGGRLCSPPPGLTSAAAAVVAAPSCPDSVGGSPPTTVVVAAPAPGLCCGVAAACKPLASSASPAPPGNAVYTVLVEEEPAAAAEDPASLRRRRARRRSSEDGGGGRSRPAGGSGCARSKVQLLQKSSSHCNGKAFPAELEPANGHLRLTPNPVVLKQPVVEEVTALRLLDETPLHHSAYIPVPRQRKPTEKAGIDEVTAAAVLTSLSTSPVVLGHHPNGFSAEMNCDVWKAAPVRSSSCSSSNHSGDGSWDPPSDFSTPSTPSPPLTADITTSILSSLQSDLEETEATQFLFGEPVPRKRKNSTKVMFKCLWKSCGKVLSSSSGMQRHIRAIHLGRKADLDQSDGEEDFYYTELDVNVDSLTDGLSSLTPVSPTSPVPPPFPVLEEVQKILPIPLNPKVSVVSHLSQSAPLNLLSQSAPTGLAHIQTDHAYQAMGPTGVLADLKAPPAGMEISISWQQPALFPPSLSPVLFKSPSSCLTPIRPADSEEKRLQGPPVSVAKGQPLLPSSVPKPATGTRWVAFRHIFSSPTLCSPVWHLQPSLWVTLVPPGRGKPLQPREAEKQDFWK